MRCTPRACVVWPGATALPTGGAPALHGGIKPARPGAITKLQKAGGPLTFTASLLASEALLRTNRGYASMLGDLAVLPDGRLASGAGDRTIKLWNQASGEAESDQPQFVADDAITSLAFLPAPPTLVAGDASGRLHWLRLPGP